MENKEFRKVFDSIAQKYGFEAAFDGWFKESDECIIVLELQKSNFGNYYELNIKTFIQGMFGISYSKNKNLVKKDMGPLLMRPPNEYKDVLSLDLQVKNEQRMERLEKLFNDFIVPYTDKTLTRAGIRELAENGLFLLPAVKKELGI